MHPALRLENLSRLPLSYRGVAILAARGNGPNVRKLYTLIQQVERAEAVPLLPAFYPQFDPAKIFDVDGDISEEHQTVVINAFIGLKALIFLVIGTTVLDDLAMEFWPRVWKWIEFLWMHLALLLPLPPSDLEPWNACSWYGAAIVCFGHRPRIAAVLKSTPSVWMLLPQNWADLLRHIDHNDHIDMFVCVCECVERLNQGIMHGDNFTQIVYGAGGTIDDLACLIADHTRFVARFFRRPISDSVAVRLLLGALTFLEHAAELDFHIISAVLSHRIVEAFVSLYAGTVDYLTTGPPQVRRIFSRVLGTMLDHEPGYPWVTQALKAGLISLIFSWGQNPDVDRTDLKHILRTSLPCATVYHSVLSQLQLSLQAASHRPLQNLQPDVRAIYLTFLEIAADRLNAKKLYDSPDYILREACDNTECGRISTRQDFRRCSGCMQTYYCSQECQIADWRAPEGHRMRCSNLKSAHLVFQHSGTTLATLGLRKNLGRRNASFLHTLLHYDYLKARKTIRTRQILDGFHPVHFSYLAPGPEQSGRVAISPEPMDSLREWISGPQLEYCSIRTDRGGGCFEMHLLHVAEGTIPRTYIVPMRSDASTIWDGVKRLNQQVPKGLDAKQLQEQFPHICEELQTLLETEVVEIH
ncbi:hypothetical protein B0H16DRAFT_649476 [Mycena metata]|uniref:MYND-type domain-containing protein n=1 Tax=Mycena metata TaxID=1033252 RepID=A0AAD7J9A1_9AGAR|nr:hypothetical protein B0H16DRAFT_649476 [Mycena metata]